MKKKSFTLVEIMIVVAIIAILAAIAVPSLASNRQTAMNQTKNANVKTIDGAVANALANDPTLSVATVVWGDIEEQLDDKYDTLAELNVGGVEPTFANGKLVYAAAPAAPAAP